MLKIKHTVWTLVAVGSFGCASGPKLIKVQNHLSEESRKLTSAVVDVLQLQPTEKRDVYSATALQLAEQDQRIEGIALEPIDVPVLLRTEEFSPEESNRAWQELDKSFAKTARLLKKEHALQTRLADLGLAAEEIRERKVRFWAKLAGFISLPVAGMIELFVLVPAAIPFVGRLLGWLVGKVPAVAGAVGVVGVKAFDAVVKGIERTRQHRSEEISGVAPTVPTSTLGNEGTGDSRRRTDAVANAAWMAQLEQHLSRGMDQAHKALVQRRKLALGV